MMRKNELVDEINKLKKMKSVSIISHFYQSEDIYSISDFIGDSLDMARKAQILDTKIVLVCGVEFMAETVKVLNPDSTVLLPNKKATCEMADMIDVKSLSQYRKNNPRMPTVAYINTSAAVKAMADICCTSKNATTIARSLGTDKVLLIPDENIANYVRNSTGKEIRSFPGYCYVHKEMNINVLLIKKQEHPNALTIAHPECTSDILNQADFVGSTGEMIAFIDTSSCQEFIVATEEGFVFELRRRFRSKIFYSMNHVCRGMKSIELVDIIRSIEREEYQIELPKEIIEGAGKSLRRMLEINA